MIGTTAEAQRSSTSGDSGGAVTEQVDSEKHETRSGSLSSQAGAVQHKQQPGATKRYVCF